MRNSARDIISNVTGSGALAAASALAGHASSGEEVSFLAPAVVATDLGTVLEI
jgi:hypothetical protein